MDIRQLKYFMAIVEEGTITSAAKRLNMTQPPLTAQLQQLETELGCELFRHEGRRLYLTDAGRHFYQRAAAIMGLCDAAAAEMGNFQKGIAGTLRLGVVSSVRGDWFMDMLASFGARYPEIKYEIYSANTYQLLDQIEAGQLDLAFVRTPFSAPDMECIHLKEEYFMAVGQAGFFYHSSTSEITPNELSKVPLIIYRRWEKVLKSAFEAAGLEPRIQCCNDDAQMTLALAARGMGVGLIPASAVPVEPDNSMIVKTLKDFNLTSQITLVCRNSQQLSQTGILFWKMVRNTSAENALPPHHLTS